MIYDVTLFDSIKSLKIESAYGLIFSVLDQRTEYCWIFFKKILFATSTPK